MFWLKILIPCTVVAVLLAGSYRAEEAAVVVPAPLVDNVKAAGSPQSIVLAGGCFWGIQGVYEHVRGVRKAISGYSGGDKATAEYETVSTGKTGHAESVKITFDPNEVTFGQILQIYFSVGHDPTQKDRQGNDRGPQYRSNIFYADASQKKIAEAYIAQLNKAKVFHNTIVTRVDPLKDFYPAEKEHQDFLIHHPNNLYIVQNDLPKIANLRKVFPSIYRVDPVTVDSAK